MLELLLWIVACAVLASWCVQCTLALRVRRNIPTFESLPAPARDSWPKLSMVVPARDEALHLEGALRTKLRDGYPTLEIVAVDDRSRDDTGAIIDRIAAVEPRVTAVHLTELPEGWLGKVHAMAQGAARASGEWILFSDADVQLEPGTLERVIAWAEAEQIDFVAIFPRMWPVAPHIDAAVVSTLRVLFLLTRSWTANTDGEGVGLGCGPFDLVRRRWLVETDALQHLRMEVIDDGALGALMKQSGARCRLVVGRSGVHMEFMPSMPALARTIEKGGAMFRFTWWRPLLFVVVPSLLDLGVPVVAIAGGGVLALVGAASLTLATVTHLLIAGHIRAPLRGAMLWPLGQLIVGLLGLRAGLRAWRAQGVTWRGTLYSRAAIERGRRLNPVTRRVTLPTDE